MTKVDKIYGGLMHKASLQMAVKNDDVIYTYIEETNDEGFINIKEANLKKYHCHHYDISNDELIEKYIDLLTRMNELHKNKIFFKYLWPRNSNMDVYTMRMQAVNVLMNKFKTYKKVFTYYLGWTTDEQSDKTEPILKKVEKRFIRCGSWVKLYYRNIGEYEPIYKSYDVNSCYPYIVTHKEFYFPIKKGRSRKLNSIEAFQIFNDDRFNNKYPFGIYKIKITGNKPDERLFHCYEKESKFDEYGLYTHIDLEILDELNVTYELDQSEENALTFYENYDLANGYDTFGELFNELYKHRKEHPEIKAVMNSIIGELHSESHQDIKIEHLAEYPTADIKHVDYSKGTFYLKDSTNFNYNVARLKPFLYSWNRKIMYDYTKKILNANYDIIYMNTDSFITNAPEDWMSQQFKVGPNMGELKIEDKDVLKGKFRIKGINKIELI